MLWRIRILESGSGYGSSISSESGSRVLMTKTEEEKNIAEFFLNKKLQYAYP